MSARYLLRLDDACPTMRHSTWSAMEAMLDGLGIKPLVGVVPDNQDPDLKIDAPSPTFWDTVRSWQGKGWSIGMHGYQHVFHPVARSKLLLPFYDKSEFAGLPLSAQAVLIRQAWAVFERERVHPKAWIAPAHCFDADTLRALAQETPIRVVSDGIALDQFHAHGFHWLPQQLWAAEPRKSGLWTICLHPSNMSKGAIWELGILLGTTYFRSRIVSVDDVPPSTRRRGVMDWLFERYFWGRGSAYQAIHRLRTARRTAR